MWSFMAFLIMYLEERYGAQPQSTQPRLCPRLPRVAEPPREIPQALLCRRAATMPMEAPLNDAIAERVDQAEASLARSRAESSVLLLCSSAL